MLRELFRHLQEFEELFQSEGIDTLNGPDGASYSIFDLRQLYDIRDRVLAPQRARAIELFLYLDMKEQDAAVVMGLSPETPVAIYATQGLRQLAVAWSEGLLWRGEGSYDIPEVLDAPAPRDLQGA